jgi:hypothetical protein
MSDVLRENEEPRPSMNVLQRLVAIFVSPKKVFADVDAGAPWWEPWVWGSLLHMIIAYTVLPIQIRLFELTKDTRPPEQFEAELAKMQEFPIKYLGVLTAPITVLFVAVIFAAISFIAVSVASERSNFKKHLGIYLWSSLVASVGVLLSNILVRAKGLDMVRSYRDALAPFGPAAFLPEGGKIWYALLSTLDVFAVWFYVLLAVGVTQVFRMSRTASLLVVLPVWLLSILIALIGVRYGGAP